MFDFVIGNNYVCKCPFCKKTCFYTPRAIMKAQKYGYLTCNSCGSEIFEESFDKDIEENKEE